jgi:hypothetical protein
MIKGIHAAGAECSVLAVDVRGGGRGENSVS